MIAIISKKAFEGGHSFFFIRNCENLIFGVFVSLMFAFLSRFHFENSRFYIRGLSWHQKTYFESKSEKKQTWHMSHVT